MTLITHVHMTCPDFLLDASFFFFACCVGVDMFLIVLWRGFVEETGGAAPFLQGRKYFLSRVWHERRGKAFHDSQVMVTVQTV